LDVDLTVSKLSSEMSTTEEQEYMFFLTWAGGMNSGVEDEFQPLSPVTSREEAANWTFALLEQITTEFANDHTRYVPRAMKAVQGESTSTRSSHTRNSDGEAKCPICDTPLYKFRGFSSYEQAQTHLEYTDDEEHEGFEVSRSTE
jgi:hypothetical protein